MRLAHRRRPHTSDTSRQGGETLIELVITVVLLGTAIITLLGALFSVVVLVNRQRATVSTSTRSSQIIETIQRTTYVKCAANPDPAATYRGLFNATYGANTQASIYSVKYLQSSSGNPAVFDTPCPAADQGAQQIVVEVANGQGTGRVVTRFTLIKRNDVCPASFTTSTLTGQRC